MEATGVLLFLLLAPAVSGEYRLVAEPKTWSEAQSYCRATSSWLATVSSEEEWAALRALVAGSGQTAAWIGLYSAVDTWRWSLDNSSIYGNGSAGESWFDFVADNYLGNQFKGYFAEGRLNDGPGGGHLKSLCYDEGSDSLVLVSTRMNWSDAESFCRQNYTGLAALRSQAQWDAADALVNSSGGFHWVGLLRDGWMWSQSGVALALAVDGVTFLPWKQGEPHGGSHNCVAAELDGWSDRRCSDPLPFICSAPVKKVLKVTLKTDGSLDPNDPLVQEAVLTQVQKDLRERGIREEVRVSWGKRSDGKVFLKTEL